MITTVRDLALSDRGSHWLALSWSLPCSERGGAVVGFNLTWCQASCEGAVVENTSYNITGLLPWTDYTVRLTVLTPGLPGGTTEPVTVRTRPGSPTSPPRNLYVVEATNITANVSWDRPVLSNGPISSYRVSLSLLFSLCQIKCVESQEFFLTYHLYNNGKSHLLRLIFCRLNI